MTSLNDSIRAMQRTLQGAAGVAVIYRRGTASVAVTAIAGSTAADVDNGAGGTIAGRVTDWLIEPGDLVLDGQLILPARNDEIVTQDDEGDVVHQVVPQGGEPCYRRSGAMYRIHTQEVGRT